MKKLLTAFSFFIFHFSFFTLYSQNIGINTTGSKPDSSAVLDLNSPNKGFLMPRVALKSLTDVTTIPNPAQYLMVFNTTTQCMVYFTGAVWQNIVCPCTGAPPTPGVISGYATPCTSSAGNIYSIAAVLGANSYTWSVPAGVAITAGAGTTSITVTFGTTSGNINVTAVNSCGTSGAATLAITLSSIPATPAVPSGNKTPITGTSQTYTISPVSGATNYNWSVSNTNGSVSSGQGTTSATINYSSTPATMNICVTADDTCGSSSPSCLSVTTSTCVVSHGTATFNYTGAPQTYTVPCGITNITLTCYGAQGFTSGYSGGLGGSATGTYTVTAGQQLFVYVGGQGTIATGNLVIEGGGWNGGGNGMDNTAGGSVCGGGGGGSDVRTVYNANFLDPASLASRIIVAGGGGGSTSNTACTGGNGGGTTGDNGGGAACGCGPTATGGSQTAGGTYGGALGQGGNALSSYSPWIGGGGGGYYGGGTSNANIAGAGGSGYIGGVTGGSMQTGVQTGNGLVLIQY